LGTQETFCIVIAGLLERDSFDLLLPEFDIPWVIHLRETCCCFTNLCTWRPNTVYKNRSVRRHHISLPSLHFFYLSKYRTAKGWQGWICHYFSFPTSPSTSPLPPLHQHCYRSFHSNNTGIVLHSHLTPTVCHLQAELQHLLLGWLLFKTRIQYRYNH
jgi:hypothetical protein